MVEGLLPEQVRRQRREEEAQDLGVVILRAPCLWDAGRGLVPRLFSVVRLGSEVRSEVTRSDRDSQKARCRPAWS